MKVLVCGSREWVDQASIARELAKLPPDTILVHGACRGADNIAGYVGRLLGFKIRPYKANWTDFKKGAGPIRNQEMLDKEHPDSDGLYIDKVLAFHEDPRLGKGTRDMVGRANRAVPYIEVTVFSQ